MATAAEQAYVITEVDDQLLENAADEAIVRGDAVLRQLLQGESTTKYKSRRTDKLVYYYIVTIYKFNVKLV